VIVTDQTGANSRGLHLHSTLATSTNGVPLGVLGAQCWPPEPKPQASSRPASAVPIEQNKGGCWIKSLHETIALAKEPVNTHRGCVMAREADFLDP
jgi:hypothetical protein